MKETNNKELGSWCTVKQDSERGTPQSMELKDFCGGSLVQRKFCQRLMKTKTETQSSEGNWNMLSLKADKMSLNMFIFYGEHLK